MFAFFSVSFFPVNIECFVHPSSGQWDKGRSCCSWTVSLYLCGQW